MTDLRYATVTRPSPQVSTAAPGSWREDAACRDYEPEWWFADTKSTADRDARETARTICRTICPVRDECLEAALKVEGALKEPSRFGIFGGMDPEERHREYARRYRAERLRARKAAASAKRRADAKAAS